MNNSFKKDTQKGYLFKWTNYLRGYQKRWFVLSNGLLSYYRNQHEVSHTCRGTINLATANIKCQDPCTIVISNEGNQTFHLKAQSENETHQWVTALHSAKKTAIRLSEAVLDDSDSESALSPRLPKSNSQSCDITSIKSDSDGTSDFNYQKEFEVKLYDLNTSVSLVKKNSESLLCVLKELSQLNITQSPSTYSINSELSSSFDLKNHDRLSTYQPSSSIIGDPRSPPQSQSNNLLTPLIQKVKEKNKVFTVSTQACVTACSEFLNRFVQIQGYHQRLLTNEREQRRRLEVMVEELAKQLGALEKKAAKQFDLDTAVISANVAASQNKTPDEDSSEAKVKTDDNSEDSEDDFFFDAVEDEHMFNVSLPRTISPHNTLEPQFTQNEYESCSSSDYEMENENSKSNSIARVIVRTMEEDKPVPRQKKTKHSHRRTASSGYPAQNRNKKNYQSVSHTQNMGVHISSNENSNEMYLSLSSKSELKSAQSVPSLPLKFGKRKPKIRRTRIAPRPNISVNLWGIMKNCIGKELSKIPVPVNFNEPLSMIQRLTEDFEYASCLDSAAVCEDDIEQLAWVAAFTVSAYSTTTTRTGKPFNPLLGETFECDRTDDLGWRSIAEQVSHHPPAAALYCESEKGWKCWQEFTMSSKFRGKYLAIIPLGIAHLTFDGSKNHYTWRKVTSTVHNIIVGKLWIDNYGEMDIVNHATGDKCHLTYKAYSYFSREPARRVTGIITDKNDVIKYVLNGTWDDYFEGAKVLEIRRDKNNQQIFETAPTKLLWKRNLPPAYSSEMYNFTTLAVQLNESEDGVAPTDSRLRPDQRLMEEGNWDEANKVKERLEEKQRDKRRKREKENEQRKSEKLPPLEHQPSWFKLLPDAQTGKFIYTYTNKYWEAKTSGNWSPDLPNIF